MSESTQETTNKFGRLVAAVGDLGEDLHEQGVIDLERLRRVVIRNDAPRRVANGESVSKIAREAGVDESTIRRDLGRKSRHKAEKVRHKAEPNHSHPLDGCDAPDDEEAVEARWEYNFSRMAQLSIELPEHWEKTFKGWDKLKVNYQKVLLAKKAASTWEAISKTLEGMSNG